MNNDMDNDTNDRTNDENAGDLIYSVYRTDDNKLHIYHHMEALGQITDETTGERVLPPLAPEAVLEILAIHEKI